MPRVAFVESVISDKHRRHRAELFPLLMAIARDVGWSTNWWVVPVPADLAHLGARYVFDLPTDTREELGEHLSAADPDLIVLHDRPTDDLRAFFERITPRARVEDLCGITVDALIPSFAEWIGAAGKYGGRSTGFSFPDHLEPVFDRTGLGVDVAELWVRLAGVQACSYVRRVGANPVYASFDDPAVTNFRGCTFCTKGMGRPPTATAGLDLTLRQIRAHQAGTRRPGDRFEYLVEDLDVVERLDRFLAAALEEELHPSTFVTQIRADQVLRFRGELEALLPRLRDAGHRLTLVSIGAENFSAVENARFNKGVTVDQLWECVDVLEAWQENFPETFASTDTGHFSAIVFTPWTTPDDLRHNITAARRLGWLWLNRVLGTRLQLLPDTPITALARRDGLLVSHGDAHDDVIAICLSDPDSREENWRFADRRTARLHQLLVRIPPSPLAASIAADDPLSADIRALIGSLPEALNGDYVGLCMALVDAVVDCGPDADVAEIFATVEDRPSSGPGETRAHDGEAWSPDHQPWAADQDGVRHVQFVHVARGAGPLQIRSPDGDTLTRAFGFGSVTSLLELICDPRPLEIAAEDGPSSRPGTCRRPVPVIASVCS